MITPREIDCPSCGKPNEYSLGSCRGCGLPREEFDRIGQPQNVTAMAEQSKPKTELSRDFLSYLVSNA